MRIEHFHISQADAVSCIIRRNLIEINRRDYAQDRIDSLVAYFSPEKLVENPRSQCIFVAIQDDKGPYPEFVNGYLIDVLLPFGLYFLLCLDRIPIKSWIVKSILVFSVGVSVEIAQFFGVPLLGRTFDPLDFVMYGAGVTLAAILDALVFPKVFGFWKLEARSRSPAEHRTVLQRLTFGALRYTIIKFQRGRGDSSN
jgi:hypothetical protein